MKKDIIERPHYTKKVQPHIGKPVIKILTGQRRIGKSYILLQLMGIIRATDESAQIIYISKELKDFNKIQTDGEVYQHIT